jgi:SAM-dependent methyltransferase
MTQEKQWDREYRDQTFLTNENDPQSDVVRFVRFLKKEFKKVATSVGSASADVASSENFAGFENLKVLDLGCGTGRNSFYFAELGASVVGLEISSKAIEIAEQNLLQANKMSSSDLDISYKKQSIGEKFPLVDSSVSIALDVTSSNSLSEAEREVYLSETARVLCPGGHFLVKALCKDSDTNAKNLLKTNPGREADTYILPDTGICERVFSHDDFLQTYQKFFTILHLEKKTSYTRMSGRLYKRNFWIAYLKK